MPPGPSGGSLPLQERSSLIDLLRTETTTPDKCWFCIWDGFGGMDFRGVSERVRHPGRHYVLYAGPMELAVASLDSFGDTPSPNLWWPDDRAWIVASEIDYAWTYVGGSSGLIETLLLDHRLEVVPATLTDKPFYGSDVVNAALDED
jgi:hypothetical protein